MWGTLSSLATAIDSGAETQANLLESVRRERSIADSELRNYVDVVTDNSTARFATDINDLPGRIQNGGGIHDWNCSKHSEIEGRHEIAQSSNNFT
jgi:hypothetical protein